MNGLGRGNDEKQNKNKAALITRETVGMTVLLFSAILLLITATGKLLFGSVGIAITAFFAGLAGFFIYPLLVLLIYASLVLVFGKKFVPARWVLRTVLILVAVFLIVHTATAEKFYNASYGSYLSACWKAAEGGIAGATGGGILYGLVVFPLRFILSAPGAYVILSVFLLFTLWFALIATPLRRYLLPVSFARTHDTREQKKEQKKQEQEGSVAFDELPAPTRRPMPEQTASYPQYAKEAAPAQAPAQPASTSRDILFRRDPSTDYSGNLAFDSSSRFNTQPRRSSMQSAGTPSQTPSQLSAPSSYTGRYSTEAEQSRPTMPRRVTEDKPETSAGYSYPLQDYDANYPQAPSYRASSAEPTAPHDYYAKDVTPEPEAPRYAEPLGEVEPPKPVEPPRYVEPPKPAEPPRYAEPLKAVEEPAPETPRLRRAEPISFDEPEEVAEEPVAPPMDTPADRESAFRSLFSQPTEERTPIGRRGYEAPVPMPEPEPEEEPEEEAPSAESRVFGAPMRRESAADLFDEPDGDDEEEEEPEIPEPPVRGRDRTGFSDRSLGGRVGRGFEPAPQPEPELPKPKERHVYKAYVRPPVEMFQQYDDAVTVSQEEIEQNSNTIIETLQNFHVETEIVNVTCGATVTRYDIDIPKGTPVNMVTKRSAELAMRLCAKKGVNMYANFEHGVISIEVPNSKRTTIGMRSLVQSDAFVNTKPNSLSFAIGKDIEGRAVVGDINEMTHLLVAGTTGSGKSVFLHSVLVSLIYKYSPEELRLILIDPKKSEFTIYEGLPHLMINEIINDSQKAVMALNWAVKEMERRYELFNQKTRSGINVRKLDEYNAKLTEDEERLPKIVIVTDEFADLMSVAKKDIEERIQRLAQKARAAGIHLILATQRPSVDVVTGVIKSNLPTRFALSVSSEIDSRVILDETGAEKLLGYGDMLYTIGGAPRVRAQGAFLSPDEQQEIIAFIKKNNEAYFDPEVSDYVNKSGGGDSEGGGDFGDGDGNVDPQYIRALGIVVNLGSASISLIQRKCSVGYNHAGKIMEWMESMGYVSPFDGKAKARTVILTREEFESKYGDIL